MLAVREVERNCARAPEYRLAERGAYRGTGNPVKLSRTPASLRSTPPDFGSDTRAVLAEAGYSAAEIDALIASGAALETPRKAAAE